MFFHPEMVVKTTEKMIENNNLQDFIKEIAIPVEEEIVENGKRKSWRKRNSPAMSHQMIYTDHLWYDNQYKRRYRFVGPKAGSSLTNEEVKRMGLEKITAEEFDITVGDNVRVISGALETFLGVVEEVSIEKQKARVIVHMFGRQTPVELEFNQIEKI